MAQRESRRGERLPHSSWGVKPEDSPVAFRGREAVGVDLVADGVDRRLRTHGQHLRTAPLKELDKVTEVCIGPNPRRRKLLVKGLGVEHIRVDEGAEDQSHCHLADERILLPLLWYDTTQTQIRGQLW